MSFYVDGRECPVFYVQHCARTLHSGKNVIEMLAVGVGDENLSESGIA